MFFAAQRLLVAEFEGLDRFDGQRADVEGQDVPFGQTAVLERVALVLRLVEVSFRELSGIGDDQAGGLEARRD